VERAGAAYGLSLASPSVEPVLPRTRLVWPMTRHSIAVAGNFPLCRPRVRGGRILSSGVTRGRAEDLIRPGRA
jgi:hypothetical protein